MPQELWEIKYSFGPQQWLKNPLLYRTKLNEWRWYLPVLTVSANSVYMERWGKRLWLPALTYLWDEILSMISNYAKCRNTQSLFCSLCWNSNGVCLARFFGKCNLMLIMKLELLSHLNRKKHINAFVSLLLLNYNREINMQKQFLCALVQKGWLTRITKNWNCQTVKRGYANSFVDFKMSFWKISSSTQEENESWTESFDIQSSERSCRDLISSISDSYLQ